MEFLTILFTGLLSLITPGGLVVDRIAENTIRSQFKQVEQLQVRVDNAPSYQLLQGKVERVQIAGRGLQLKQLDLRIAALELETDPIDVEPRSLRNQPQLRRPIQTGVRLVLLQKDINKALQSPKLTDTLRKLSISEFRGATGNSRQRYNFVNPRVEFLANDRLRLQVELSQGKANLLAITVESGLDVVAGRQLRLIQPTLIVNGEAAPSQFVQEVATNLAQRLDLRSLEAYGLQARILQFKVAPQKLEIAAFLRVEPSAKLLKPS